ncbi:hypothetical protein INH39_25575 [Massilia violaceinigra]|uniref:SGNH hydrolase-type esterase domain-containing protein n=1 Tax=Massilia violaceinigra TaxID=2045208 RepID=A0ABY4A2A8_9BURK|nr:hypothetical protein [Massilia violaceinigra]UOD28782.1 hypothetical protein INH39_25575 [Massilia violaceinigra]
MPEINIIGQTTTAAQTVAVTAAPTSAGTAYVNPRASSSVTIVNTTAAGQDADVQYQLNATGWKRLGRSEGVTLAANVAADTLYFRRNGADPGTVEVSMESAPVISAGSAPVAIGVTTGPGNAVGLGLGARMRRLGVDSIKGAAKWFGNTIGGLTFGTLPVNGSAYRATSGLLMVAEAPFYALQLVVVNQVNNAITGLRAIAGVTESIDTSVAANRCKPVIGGVAYGAMAAAGSVNGFYPLTWGGQATPTIPASVTSAQFAVSDILPVNSVPRADVPGALPAVVIRVDQIPATGGNYSFVLTSAAMRTATAANRGRVVQTFNTGADALTNPNVNLNLSGDTPLIFPIFHYAVPSLTVAVCGDSTEQNDSLVTDVFTSWGYRGCADASSPKRPVNYLNLGSSSKTAPEYWARCQEIIAAGVPVDTLVIGPASVNDGYTIGTIARLFSDAKSRAMEIVRFCRANGISNLIWIPLLPFNSNTTAQDAYRLEFNAWLATIPGTTTLNFPALGNGATPERWVATMNFSADGIHPSELAIDTVMAPALTAALNAIA